MTNKEYIELTKQLVAKKNKDCRRYLKEQKEEIKRELKKIQILADEEQCLKTDLALQNLLEKL